MTLRKGAVGFNVNELRVPLAVGDIVPCPKCAGRHFVQRDPRPGASLNTFTGALTPVPNTVLFIECPDAPGPIIVGLDGKALPTPLELAARSEFLRDQLKGSDG